MSNSLKIMMLTFIMTSALMLFTSFLMYLSGKDKRYFHLMQFWIGYLVFALCNAFLLEMNPRLMVFALAAFALPVILMNKLTSDMAKKKLQRKWYSYILFGGNLAAMGSLFFELPLLVHIFPSALSYVLVGLSMTYSCYKAIPKSTLDPLRHLFLINLLAFCLQALDFSYLRLNSNYASLGFSLSLLNMLFLAIILPCLTIHDLLFERSKILQLILEERNRQLEKQSKMSSLGEIAASLVHELNNPLGILLGRNGLMLQKVESGQYDKSSLLSGLAQMDGTIHRMMKITQSLKSFSRDSENDPMRTICLQKLMDETLAFCHERFLEGNIPLLVGKVPEVHIQCRSVQISQVLLNLLNNAYDAVGSLENQWVRVDFELSGDFLRILVIDSGHGIPEEIQTKIMQPFFTTKKSGQGTGLGLSISHEIIKEHQGRLLIGPDLLNTTFVVELPYSNLDLGLTV